MLHVLLSEQKLAVQVGEVDCVEIEKGDMTEPGKHDVLDWRKNGEQRVPKKWKKHTELAADTASTDHEYFDVGQSVVQLGSKNGSSMSVPGI